MNQNSDLNEIHLLMQIMDNMDAGLIVIDLDYNVCTWNSFMRSYSGIDSDLIHGHCLFDFFPDLPKAWFMAKVQSVIKLQMRTFSSWEERPYLFEFNNFSPVTHGLSKMYQNVVFSPLRSLTGEITHVSIKVQDVSDIAKKKLFLKESNQKLSQLSRTDGLTGLYNRGYWEQCLQEQFARCQTVSSIATLVMFDIDFFKKVNDTYGHTAGDGVIRNTAYLLKQTVRKADVCGRYGGEEFGVLLPDTNAEQAHYFSERLRKKVEAGIVDYEGEPIRYTISLGICQIDPDMESHTQWLEAADKALYTSKQSGRNLSTIYQ
ncbi:sensor domain-containing diguanylate cyclase [Vibrio sp. SCSIO 43136]|uniref:GGDEF domain-containing protein n=1 Tax=Vibrio sp. SCSIO 43136 TaxID=2819101 RepID=UPI0020750DCA|nr:sensor domain-containing diguanylate cyclase [Vibrio sp. SCSIO 43136]USD66590.1 diguanylate cyclase [Vibrio sp. SCSIO 43136]